MPLPEKQHIFNRDAVSPDHQSPHASKNKIQKEQRAAMIASLLQKVNALDAHAQALQQLFKNQSEEAATEGGLAFYKGQILKDIARVIRCELEKFDLYIDPKPSDWHRLKSCVNEAVETVCSESDFLTLAIHRAPLLRWAKEFLMLFATLMIGSLAVTAYNAVCAKSGTFSWQLVGFFSNPTSINLVDDLLKGVKTTVETGAALERKCSR